MDEDWDDEQLSALDAAEAAVSSSSSSSRNVVRQSRDYGLDFLCYDFSEELFIESNRCEEFDLTQIFFKNVSTVLHCVVLMKNVSHGREMEGI